MQERAGAWPISAGIVLALAFGVGCAAVTLAERTAITPEKPSDRALMERLCAGSPYTGAVTIQRATGTQEVFFTCAGGKFNAEVRLNTSPPLRSGPAQFLRIENGVVRYISPAGADVELTLDSEGWLVGRVFHPYGGTGNVVLSPSK